MTASINGSAAEMTIFEYKSPLDTPEVVEFGSCVSKKFKTKGKTAAENFKSMKMCREKAGVSIIAANYTLGSTTMVKALKEKADQYLIQTLSNPKAQLQEQKKSLQKNFITIIKLIEPASKVGIEEADLSIANLYVGYGQMIMDMKKEEVLSKAVKHYISASNAGVPSASTILAGIYSNKNNGEYYDPKQAQLIYMKALAKGELRIIPACLAYVGEIDGESVSKEHKLLMNSVYALMDFASKDEKYEQAIAAFRAEMHWNGWTVKKDKEKAIGIYKTLDPNNPHVAKRLKEAEKQS